MNNVADLSLDDLKKGLPGVTPVLGNFHAQACLVCFYERKHTSGVKLETKGTFASVFAVNWQDAITDQILQAWGDPEVATEQAAYGIAFLLVLKLTPFTVIRKSKKGTGFDYWLGEQSTINQWCKSNYSENSAMLSVNL